MMRIISGNRELFTMLNINTILLNNVFSSFATFPTVRSTTQISAAIDGDWRMRRTISNQNSTSNSPSRFQNNSKVSLNRRSLQHHQSNGSLHSENSPSSSTSPAASPLPRPATVQATSPLQLNALQTSQTTVLNSPNGANSPTGLNKRWSSTGDFATSPTTNSSASLQSSRYATKSLLNLNGNKNGINGVLKHGWVCFVFCAAAKEWRWCDGFECHECVEWDVKCRWTPTEERYFLLHEIIVCSSKEFSLVMSESRDLEVMHTLWI